MIINNNNASTALRTHNVLGSELRAAYASSIVLKYGTGVGCAIFPFKDAKQRFREV